jgi:hypothetical protein
MNRRVFLTSVLQSGVLIAFATAGVRPPARIVGLSHHPMPFQVE